MNRRSFSQIPQNTADLEENPNKFCLAASSLFYTEGKLFLQKLQHANNKCDLIDEALEKTELTEKKTFGFFLDYPLQKIVRFFASERFILAPDNNQ